jgi:hypothetical protein
MNRHITLLATAALAAFAFFTAAPAHAQATRTWVSGVGDDVNPCSRTAPCKTFAGAISKTAAGGEINCLDPGGFGAVTIIKSMTIDCLYTEGGVLAGGNGIVVNLPAATDVVRLRGLDIFGVNPPTNGIRFIGLGSLIVDNCRIARFNASGSFGISAQPSGNNELFVSNTLIMSNGTGATGGGVLLQPTGTGSIRATFSNVDIVDNTQGFRADSTGGTNVAPIKVAVEDSSAVNNAFAGWAAVTTGVSGPVELNFIRSNASYNVGAGFTANGTGAKIRLGSSMATGNGTGTLPTASGVVESYQNNQIDGNTSDGSRTNIALE